MSLQKPCYYLRPNGDERALAKSAATAIIQLEKDLIMRDEVLEHVRESDSLARDVQTYCLPAATNPLLMAQATIPQEYQNLIPPVADPAKPAWTVLALQELLDQ